MTGISDQWLVVVRRFTSSWSGIATRALSASAGGHTTDRKDPALYFARAAEAYDGTSRLANRC